MRSVKSSSDSFKPGLLEVMETRPSLMARVVSITLMIVVGVAILWAVFAEMDVVVSAQGKVSPGGQVKVIQAAEPGAVTAIHVGDGQHVNRGDTVVELDATTVRADLDRLLRENQESQLQIARLGAQLEQDAEAFNPGHGADAKLAGVQRRLLQSRLAEHHANMDVLLRTIDQQEAETERLASAIEGLQAELPLLQRKTEKYAKLVEAGAVSEMEVIAARIESLTARRELETSRHRLVEAQATLAATVHDHERAIASFRADTLNELMQASIQRDALEKEIIKVRQRLQQLVITSPVDGTVQQLSVTTIGGVVTAAQSLMVIVPDDASLEVNAQVLNRDVGSLRSGLPVRLKVDAYPFTRHGTVAGDIEWVGTNSIDDERLGLVYPVRIQPSEAQLPNTVNGSQGQLTPGMSVTADIVVGKRRVIDYFIGPLLRYKDESLREM